MVGPKLDSQKRLKYKPSNYPIVVMNRSKCLPQHQITNLLKPQRRSNLARQSTKITILASGTNHVGHQIRVQPNCDAQEHINPMD